MFLAHRNPEGAMMKPKHDTKHEADKLVRNIKRATRRKFNAILETHPAFQHLKNLSFSCG